MGQRLFKSEPIKFLEENIGVHPCDRGFDNKFLDMTSKAQVTKEKINQTS